ncbi:hypothetical protein ACQ4PT_027932 [Festuca glaucescens]
MEKKRVVIIGAGVSGLAACKHLLERGCRPVVFEADTLLGGVWARTPDCTSLQSERAMYQYSDFPWPDTPSPRCSRTAARSPTTSMHMRATSGCSTASGSGIVCSAWSTWVLARRRWRRGRSGQGAARRLGMGSASGGSRWPTQRTTLSQPLTEFSDLLTCKDFVVFCIGRFSGVPNIPTFSPGKGPEAFDGQVIHTMDYSKMGTKKANEMLKGKRVTVIGYLKSALDVAADTSTEHPCTMVVRTKHWIFPNYYAWGFPISYLYLNRFSEFLIHKPGEGFLLSLVATILTPLRWLFSKFAESYYSIPMKKHDMVPEHSLFEALVTCLIAITPKDHYKRLDEGSIILKKSKTFTFCKEGVLVEGESSPVKSDVVIFGTGFKGDQKIKDMFVSEYFQSIAVGPTSSTLPLYRECIHPKIPQLAVLGYSESLANLYTSEIRAKWLAHFLDGGFRLPSVKSMQSDILEWEKFMKRYSRSYFRRSCIGVLHIWYNDLLCKDMGCNPRRKKGFFAELFDVYGPSDYINLRPK